MSALSKNKMTKVISLNTTYKVEKKIKDIYEGNERVNWERGQQLREDKNMKMEEGEDIERYFEKVDNVVNEIR